MTDLPEPVSTDRMGVLLAAYEYEPGSCFRCPRWRVQVARIGETPLYACRECVQDLLTMHERSMERLSPYPWIVQIPRDPRGVETP